MAVDVDDLTSGLDPEDIAEVDELIKRAWKIRNNDLGQLTLIDDYIKGNQPAPYVPDDVDDEEYKILAERSVTPMLRVIRDTAAQSLFVEGYIEAQNAASPTARTGKSKSKIDANTPLWAIWQRNGLDAKQIPIAEELTAFGLTYVGVKKPGGAIVPGANAYDYPRAFTLSAMDTVALYEDPYNDEWPIFVFTVDKEPEGNKKPGRGRYWDNLGNYEKFEFDSNGERTKTILAEPHGFDRVPVVPFYCSRDLRGNATGIIEHLMVMQDRLNQSVFDMLVVQSFGSFRINTVAGMTPPPKLERQAVYVVDIRHELPPNSPWIDKPDDTVYGYRWVPVVDADGNPVPGEVRGDPGRFIMSEDPNTKFGTLEPTELEGFIKSIGMTLSHLAIAGQLPPYYLLGDIANLSADALSVAESSLHRLVWKLQHTIGESWERVLLLLGLAAGRSPEDIDYEAQVKWADTTPKAFGTVVDGIVKLVEGQVVPRRSARRMVPGATDADVQNWEADEEEGDPFMEASAEAQLASALQGRAPRATKSKPTASGGRQVAQAKASAAK